MVEAGEVIDGVALGVEHQGRAVHAGEALDELAGEAVLRLEAEGVGAVVELPQRLAGTRPHQRLDAIGEALHVEADAEGRGVRTVGAVERAADGGLDLDRGLAEHAVLRRLLAAVAHLAPRVAGEHLDLAFARDVRAGAEAREGHERLGTPATVEPPARATLARAQIQQRPLDGRVVEDVHGARLDARQHRLEAGAASRIGEDAAGDDDAVGAERFDEAIVARRCGGRQKRASDATVPPCASAAAPILGSGSRGRGPHGAVPPEERHRPCTGCHA